MMREDYFTWPEQWTLGSCGAAGDDHLRRPRAAGPKDPRDISALVVGLNPGHREMKLGEYFVGPAGRYLRTSARWEPFWAAVGQANHVIVTNIVKLFTRREDALEGDPRVPDCVRQCFLAEVQALPNLARVYILGDGAWILFKEFAWPETERLRIYRLRHPSFSWVINPEVFDQDLQARLAKPRMASPPNA